jgi:hypothetical protein
VVQGVGGRVGLGSAWMQHPRAAEREAAVQVRSEMREEHCAATISDHAPSVDLHWGAIIDSEK